MSDLERFRRMFGPFPHSLFEALRRDMIPDAYMPEAIEILKSYSYPRKPQTHSPATADDIDPWQENAIRALEGE